MASILRLVVFLMSSYLCLSQEATTPHMHHTTHEHSEMHKMTFFYDDPSNYFILNTNGVCYFLHLNSQEEAMVHTPEGIINLEAQMIHMMTSATQLAMRGGDHAHISHAVYNRICAHEHMVRLVLAK